MTTLFAVRGLEKTGAGFRAGLVALGERLSIDPNYLTPVMANESGFNPAATNRFSNATGLIQFMPATARYLGTTVDDLRGMSAEDQLPYVEAYYRPFAGRIQSAGDAYMATFMPKFIGASPDTIIAQNPSIAYAQNRGLDHGQKGYITVGDVESIAEALYAEAQSKPPLTSEDDSSVSPLALLPLLGLGLWALKAYV